MASTMQVDKYPTIVGSLYISPNQVNLKHTPATILLSIYKYSVTVLSALSRQCLATVKEHPLSRASNMQLLNVFAAFTLFAILIRTILSLKSKRPKGARELPGPKGMLSFIYVFTLV
jgi:hypothetical protein